MQVSTLDLAFWTTTYNAIKNSEIKRHLPPQKKKHFRDCSQASKKPLHATKKRKEYKFYVK